MKYLLSILAIITLAVAGCKKEKTNVDTRPPKRLSKIINHYSSFRTENLLSYDKDGYLSQQKAIRVYDDRNEESATTITYKRDAEHKIVQETTTDDHAFQVATYKYNNQGHVARIDYGDGTLIYYYYMYKWENNKLTEIESYANDNTLVANIRFTYNNKGNITEAAYSQNAGGYTVRDIVYDDAANPLSTVAGLPHNIYSGGFSFQNYTINNMISARVVQRGQSELQYYSPEYDNLGSIVKESQNGTPQYREFVYENY